MTPAQRLIDRLERVRETRPGHWSARCPAHDDHTPSLSIDEAADETLLIHCFAGCAPGDVLAAVGLSLSDLYPEPPQSRGRATRSRWSARELVEILSEESLIIVMGASDLRAGRAMSDEDLGRVALAEQRIRRVRSVAGL